MKVLGSETICPFSSQWLSKAFKFVQKLGRELTFRGALENTSARHAARPNLPSTVTLTLLQAMKFLRVFYLGVLKQIHA